MCQYLVSICATFGLFGISAATLFDRFMFGFLAIPMLGNLHFNVLEGKLLFPKDSAVQPCL